MNAPVSLSARASFLGRTLPMREVAKLPIAWFQAPMLATAAARGRLRAWAADGAPDADLDAVAFLGDSSVRPLIVARLAHVPTPVRHDAIRSTLFVGIGREAAGQIEAAPCLGPDITRVITIAAGNPDDREVDAVIGHELAHGWLGAKRTPTSPRLTRSDALSFLTSIVADGQVEAGAPGLARDLASRYVDAEVQAARLANHWGCVGHAADPRRVSRLTTRNVRRVLSPIVARSRSDATKLEASHATHHDD